MNKMLVDDPFQYDILGYVGKIMSPIPQGIGNLWKEYIAGVLFIIFDGHANSTTHL